MDPERTNTAALLVRYIETLNRYGLGSDQEAKFLRDYADVGEFLELAKLARTLKTVFTLPT